MVQDSKKPDSDDSTKPNVADTNKDTASARLSEEGWAKKPNDTPAAPAIQAKDQPTDFAARIEKGKPFSAEGDAALRGSLDKWAALNNKDSSADIGGLR